jgi:hypothetical protein
MTVFPSSHRRRLLLHSGHRCDYAGRQQRGDLEPQKPIHIKTPASLAREFKLMEGLLGLGSRESTLVPNCSPALSRKDTQRSIAPNNATPTPNLVGKWQVVLRVSSTLVSLHERQATRSSCTTTKRRNSILPDPPSSQRQREGRPPSDQLLHLSEKPQDRGELVYTFTGVVGR